MPKFIHTNSSGKRKNTLLTDIQKAIEKPSQSSSKKELLNKKVKKGNVTKNYTNDKL